MLQTQCSRELEIVARVHGQHGETEESDTFGRGGKKKTQNKNERTHFLQTRLEQQPFTVTR